MKDASEQEKLLKEEELKLFNVKNALLLEYLEENSLYMENEDNEDFDDEDELQGVPENLTHFVLGLLFFIYSLYGPTTPFN